MPRKPKQDVDKGQEAPQNPLGNQPTFTEDEIKKLEDFYNYCFLHLITKAGVSGDMAKKHLEKFHPFAFHIKKCRDHIFDFEKSFTVSKDGKVRGMKD